MNEKIRLVKQMLTGEYSLDEIQRILSISNREFSYILKTIRDRGYIYTPSYFSDGHIYLKMSHSLNLNPSKITRIAVKDKVLRSVFISDLHIGSIYERPDLMKKVKEYAVGHNIHIIFNCGDFIDNVYPESNQKLNTPTVNGQIRRAVRVYPYDSSIINFNLYGNHDYKSILDEGLDIAKVIQGKRYDLVSLGYGEAIIGLKDDKIAVTHDLKKSTKNNPSSDVTITFRGHSHKSKNSFKEAKMIYVPSLSEDRTSAYEYRPLPGFLDVEFKFYDKKIERVNVKQLAIINGETRLANEEALILRKIPNRNYGQRPIDKK